jgi:hypothetical protein
MYKIIGSDGQQYGPITAEQLRQWLTEGRVNTQTQVQPDGVTDWKPLSSLPEFTSPTPPPLNLLVPPASAPAAPVKTSGLAITSLVLGCLGTISCGLTAIVGFILGLIGLRKINRSNGQLGGKGLAIAGISVSAAMFFLILPLMAALAIPGFVKARKQSQGRRIVNDVRQMDAAIDQWALEKGKTNGSEIVKTEVVVYLKTEWKEADILGNRYQVGVVGPNQIMISPATKAALDEVGVDWGAF